MGRLVSTTRDAGQRLPDLIEIRWTYTVTATVLGVNTSLSDTVDVSVVDLGAPTPPAGSPLS